ncbi:MAG: type II toxin-antitoxin system HicB family antitoxin [Candidatus Bipolaricaulia bacterium]
MNEEKYIPVGGAKVKSYVFKVVLEPDEDVWAAYIPALVEKGASTWGHTKEEALKNIQEVVQLVIESMTEHGEPIPEG